MTLPGNLCLRFYDPLNLLGHLVPSKAKTKGNYNLTIKQQAALRGLT